MTTIKSIIINDFNNTTGTIKTQATGFINQSKSEITQFVDKSKSSLIHQQNLIKLDINQFVEKSK